MRLFKVFKTMNGQKMEMVADESQLPSLKSDSRFEIGEELKPVKGRGKKDESIIPNPPAELPEEVKK